MIVCLSVFVCLSQVLCVSVKQYGLPVFMEKPLLPPGQLDRIDQADPAWQNLMINFNRRFWPTYQRIGAQVSDGRLERLSHARFVLKINAAKWSTVTDHRAKEREGGVLYDLGSQALDLLSVTFQLKPTEILARRSGMGGFDDRVQLTLGFSDGFTADCDLAYGTYNQESITIWANNTVLNLYDPNCVAWVGRDPWGVLRFLRTLVDWPLLAYRGIFRGTSMLRYSVRASLEAFLAALKSAAPFNPGFNDAFRVARYTEAARRSIETGRSISFE